MSSSITIPSGPTSTSYSPTEKSPGSSSSSSYYNSPTTPSKTQNKTAHGRRPSLLSAAISKQECTVINIGDPDGPARLISYLSSGQGFTWNPEIFLPSYIDHDYVPLENRRDPIHEIYLTDEEAATMLPQ